jgi:hypothetical protein
MEEALKPTTFFKTYTPRLQNGECTLDKEIHMARAQSIANPSKNSRFFNYKIIRFTPLKLTKLLALTIDESFAP